MRNRTFVIVAFAVAALVIAALLVRSHGGGLLRSLAPAIHGR